MRFPLWVRNSFDPVCHPQTKLPGQILFSAIISQAPHTSPMRFAFADEIYCNTFLCGHSVNHVKLK